MASNIVHCIVDWQVNRMKSRRHRALDKVNGVVFNCKNKYRNKAEKKKISKKFRKLDRLFHNDALRMWLQNRKCDLK